IAVLRLFHQNLLFHHSRKFYFQTHLNFGGITDSLETHKRELEADLANAEPPAPVLQHPNLSDVYRDKVANLTEALNDPATKATPIIRSLLESMRLLPRGFGGLEIELVGELAGLLSLGMSQDDKSHPRLRTLKRH
ncbi:hypothetical protein SAMN04488036_1141, partial [Shimia haliotis]